jgi:internalin A
MKKPAEITFLKKHLNITLNHCDSKYTIVNSRNENTYQLNDNNIVIGLNLVNTIVEDISFLSKFPQITSLILNNNEVITDYNEIANLNFLEILHLSGNNIKDISFVQNLKSLIDLNLDRNEISDIASIENLTQLRGLKLWRNQISDISALKNLKNLTHLTLWNNKIENINPLENLTNLGTLDLEANSIFDLTPIQKLINLDTLYLNSNQINDIKILSNLEKLRNLFLKKNNIEDISVLQSLNKLNAVDLSSNIISDYSTLKNIKSLKSLALNNCDLTDGEFINGLIDLERLHLNSNQISDITFLKHLRSLTHLDLSNNIISDIFLLKDLDKLEYINLNDNLIISIQPLLPLITNGIGLNSKLPERGLKIQKNPLEYPPIPTLNEGNEAIIRFFKKIEKEGTDAIYEVKVTLVGEGSAGKTSLLKRILDPKSNLPEEKNRTRGISIEDWEFKKQINKKHIAHIWDFGGQDVYYPVHRFFLTEDSVFVLLASSRHNNHNFEYWIPTIFQFGGKSPIILVQTCHDGNSTHWNDIGMYIADENFNIIKDQSQNYHELNLPKANKGLIVLKKTIIAQILKLPHYRKNVPKSWILVRELISNISKNNCISYLELKDKIYKLNPASFATKEDIEDCVKFFHSIGVLLWYHKEDKLRNWVILNPKWAVDAVYKIIDHKKNTNQGIILSSDFEIVWKAKMYEDKHDILKEMLEVFKIAFPKKTNKSDFIMPTRLESIPHEEIWTDTDSCLSIVYTYHFMPKGMVNQISAELSRFIKNDKEVWNNGVNFYNGQTISQVFEDYHDRKIIIKSKGSDARGLMMIIMNAVRDITDSYKGVKTKISIPCSCKQCMNESEPFIYSYDNLIAKIEKNKDATVTCNISDKIFKIESLLLTIGLDNPSKEKIDEKEKKELKLDMKTIKIFLASSAELKDERKEFREFISVENDRLHTKGIYLQIVQWEYFLDEISNSRLQDEYNNELKKCDIALCLFFTKVGKFTEEEFDTAYETFKSNGIPKMWTYFKDSSINTGSIDISINTLFSFKEKLKNLGHFFTAYNSTPDLQLKFKRQLEKFIED